MRRLSISHICSTLNMLIHPHIPAFSIDLWEPVVCSVVLLILLERKGGLLSLSSATSAPSPNFFRSGYQQTGDHLPNMVRPMCPLIILHLALTVLGPWGWTQWRIHILLWTLKVTAQVNETWTGIMPLTVSQLVRRRMSNFAIVPKFCVHLPCLTFPCDSNWTSLIWCGVRP